MLGTSIQRTKQQQLNSCIHTQCRGKAKYLKPFAPNRTRGAAMNGKNSKKHIDQEPWGERAWETDKCDHEKNKGRIPCVCPPSFASVAAETKIRRGVQTPKHRRTSSHAAQAALAIAPPPLLPPSLLLQGQSNAQSLSSVLSLSPVFSLPYRAMAHGNEKKAAFSAKKNPPFGFSILNFLGVFSCFSAVLGHFKLFTRRCWILWVSILMGSTTLRTAAPGAPAEARTRGYSRMEPTSQLPRARCFLKKNFKCSFLYFRDHSRLVSFTRARVRRFFKMCSRRFFS